MELENNPKYLISCDFGQINDYTAVAVTERRLVEVGERYQHVGGEHLPPGTRRTYETRQNVEQTYDLIRLDRVPLRTPYTTVAQGIVKLIKEMHRRHAEELGGDIEGAAVRHPRDSSEPLRVGLAIDEGGVGKAVRDILIKEMIEGLEKGKPKVRFLPVTVHGGANTTHAGGFYHVPKRDLVSAGLVAYQNGKLRVGKLRYRDVLEEELANYRLKQNLATGNVAFEPLREGQHDDLLFATCLAIWAWEYGIKKIKHLSYPNQILTEIPPHLMAQYG
jgi:hypothetical protein